MKKCPICGKDFTPKNPKGQVCSAGCRKKLERARKEIVKLEAIVKELPKEYGPIKRVGILQKDGTIFTIKQMPKGLSLTEQIQWKIDNTQ